MLSLTKKNPDELFSSFDDAMESLFGSWQSSLPRVAGTSFTQAYERKSDELYELWIDMPGVKKEDVKLTIEGGTLSVSGTRRDIKGEHVRSIRIGSRYDEDAVEAKLEDGVLYIKIPIKPSAKKKAKQIEIK